MRTLTGKERLRRCYFHEEVDRPAVYVRWGGMMANADPTYAEMKRLVLERSDVKLTWEATHLVEAPPVTRRTEPYDERYDVAVSVLHTPRGDLVRRDYIGRQGQPGYCAEHYLKTEEDCERYLSLPEPAVGGDCSPFFRLVRDVGDRGIVDVYAFDNPAGAVVELMGSEGVALMTRDARELVHRLMDRQCRTACRVARFLLESGVGPYFSFSGEEYLAPPLHGRSDFFEFDVAYDQRVTRIVHEAGGRVHVHCHGSIRTVLDGFIELGCDVLHPFEAPPMGDVTPREAKEALRGRITLEGNIQIADMYEADPDNIRAQVRGLARDVFDDRRGLIVCATASPYREGEGALCTPRYRAMIEEVLAMGT